MGGKVSLLYVAAEDSRKAFHKHLKRQFGDKWMFHEYKTHDHDTQTTEAQKAFSCAMNRWNNAALNR